jgi:hypothetical protein
MLVGVPSPTNDHVSGFGTLFPRPLQTHVTATGKADARARTRLTAAARGTAQATIADHVPRDGRTDS